MRAATIDVQEVSVLMLDAIDVESSSGDEAARAPEGESDDLAFADTFVDTLIQ
jgi:hypothetical protein